MIVVDDKVGWVNKNEGSLVDVGIKNPVIFCINGSLLSIWSVFDTAFQHNIRLGLIDCPARSVR